MINNHPPFSISLYEYIVGFIQCLFLEVLYWFKLWFTYILSPLMSDTIDRSAIWMSHMDKSIKYI